MDGDIIEPHRNDVLMGRGGNAYKWYGNEQLRVMAWACVDDYLVATKVQKSLIVR